MKSEKTNNTTVTLNHNNIPESWKKVKLGKIAKIKGGKRLPKGKSLVELPTKHPYIRTRDIHNNKIAVNELLFVPDDVFPDILRYIVEKDDIIISIVGTIGLCAIIPNELHLASLTENCTKLVDINTQILHKNFLFYYLISEYGQEEINIRNVGSTQPKLPLYNIKGIPIPLPPLPEQKAIASVLSSIDDKIDLLHRQNKTLEAMAETLFRKWFVEEAREDWEEGCLDDVIELIYGKGLKKEIRTGKGYPVIGSNGVVGYHSEFLVEGPGIVIGRKGTLGKVIYLWDNFFPIDTTYYIKSKVESAGLLYEYFLLKTLNFKEMNSDSAVPGLNRDIALSTEIKIAPLEKLQKFDQFASTFIDKLRENTKQIRTLEKLRDTLLPKLMSGEVRCSWRV
jgi:type I restriction enzyme S subunit